MGLRLQLVGAMPLQHKQLGWGENSPQGLFLPPPNLYIGVQPTGRSLCLSVGGGKGAASKPKAFPGPLQH